MPKRPLAKALQSTMIQEVPAYANKFMYSLGFLSMTCLLILFATGIVMAVNGPDWWLLSTTGRYFRSVHLWATQAFVLFIILHVLIVFFSSGFKKPRRLTWVLGGLMFLFVVAEAEFGYVLRDDFSSQWRALQGADFYNGSGLGHWIANTNYAQIYGIHVVAVPLLILGLLFFHYLLVKFHGIAKPHRSDVHVATVKANHTILFVRGGVLIGLVLLLAAIFPSPMLRPNTVQNVAANDPKLIGQTLMKEFDHSSDTATYLDNIDPYKFDTRQVYISQPYNQYVSLTHSINYLDEYNQEPAALQAVQLKTAENYYDTGYPASPTNPVEQVGNSLINMAQSGLYEPALNSASNNGDKTTYSLRFLADTGVLDTQAQNLNITTDQYGMLREEKGNVPPGAWWLAPIGLLNHTVLANDDNGDRDGAAILGLFMLLVIAFPFVPGLNRLPEWFRLYKFIWRTK